MVAGAAAAGPPLHLKTHAGDPAKRPPATLLKAPSATGRTYFLVQFDKPPDAADLGRLKATGAEVLEAVPQWGYFVRMDKGRDAADLMRVKGVRFAEPMRAIDAMSPDLKARAGKASGDIPARVVAWQGESPAAVAAGLEQLGAKIHSLPQPTRHALVHAFLPRDRLDDAAAIGGVEFIEAWLPATERNDRATWSVQSNVEGSRPFREAGLRGEDEIVGHIDSGIDIFSCFLSGGGVAVGPNHRKIQGIWGGLVLTAHGTHTAGTAVGFNIDGTLGAAGHAPGARLTHGNYRIAIPDLREDAPGNLEDFGGLLERLADDGAAVFTNSWGVDGLREYTYLAVAADTHSWENPESLLVFASTNGNIVYTPENAKNVLAVGASRSAPENDVYFSGGIGPTADGRRKPELYAPGEGIVSATLGVCQLEERGGTSMAAPAVAASALLLRQYFREGWYPDGIAASGPSRTVSGALLKALLVGAGQDMVSIPGYPSVQEGWGRLQLDRAVPLGIDAPHRTIVWDETTGLLTGDERTETVIVTSGNEPLRVTLAWMDPPAAHAAALATINDFDLRVVGPDGLVYTGNGMANGASIPGAGADTLNNVEVVRLPEPLPGVYTVTVDGGFADPLFGRQPFGLVAGGAVAGGGTRNAVAFRRAFVRPGAEAGVLAVLRNPGDTPEPRTVAAVVRSPNGDNETVTLVGGADLVYTGTIPLVGEASAPGDGMLSVRDGDVLTVEGPDATFAGNQTLVDAVAPRLEAIEIDRNFGDTVRIRAVASEDSTVTALALRDGLSTTPTLLSPDPGVLRGYTGTLEGLQPGADYDLEVFLSDRAGNELVLLNPLGFGFTTATMQPLQAYPFDGDLDPFSTARSEEEVPGWQLIQSADAPSPPWLFFIENTASAQDAVLTSPVFDVPTTGSTRMTFLHRYAFGAGQRDGGVLEIQDAVAGTWSDIGDRFLRGGYNGPIAATPVNTLYLRRAWTGVSGNGFARVTIDLAAYRGMRVRLRWRFASDDREAGTGWWVDDVQLDLGEVPGIRGNLDMMGMN